MTAISVRRYLIFAVCAVAAILFLAITCLNSFWVRPELEAYTEQHLNRSAQIQAEHIALYFNTPYRQIQSLTQLHTRAPIAPTWIEQVLDAQVKSTTNLDAAYMVDPSGTLQAVGLPRTLESQRTLFTHISLSNHPLYKQAILEKKTVWSNLFFSPISRRIAIGFASPHLGYVYFGELNLTGLNEEITSRTNTNSNLVLLLDQAGNIIYDSQNRHSGQQLNVSQHPIVQLALNGEIQHAQAFELDKQSYIASVAKTPNTPWLVLYAEPSDIAYQNVDTISHAMLTITLIFLLIGSGLALFSAHRFAGMLTRLGLRTKQLAQGEALARTSPFVIKELNLLSACVDSMANDIHARQNELRTLTNNLPGVIFRCHPDINWTFIFLSPGASTLFGLPYEQLLATKHKGLKDFIHPDDWQTTRNEIMGCFNQSVPWQTSFRLLHSDGAIRWLRVYGQGITDEHTGQHYLEGFLVDVSERIQASQALRASEARYSTLIRHLPMALFIIDAQGCFTLADGKALKRIGFTSNEVIGLSAFDLYRSYPSIINALQRALAGEYLSHEVEIAGVWFESVYEPFALTGQAQGVMITNFDITDRKQGELEQARNIARMESLIRISHAPSENIQELLNYALQEALVMSESTQGYIYQYEQSTETLTLISGKACPDCQCHAVDVGKTHPLNQDPFCQEVVTRRQATLYNHLADQTPPRFTFAGCPNALNRIVNIPLIIGEKIQVIIGLANKELPYTQVDIYQLTLLMGAVWQLVEQKQAEIALQRSTALLNASQGLAHVGGWEINVRDNSLYWTEETYRIHEVDAASFTPDIDSALHFYHASSRPIISNAVQAAIEEGQGFDLELCIVTAKGHLRDVHVYCDLHYHDGVLQRISGACQDITAYKHIENELRAHQEQLERLIDQRTAELIYARDCAESATHAKSAFLASMSHEIRTPINAIMGMTHLALQTKLDAQQRDYLNKVHLSSKLLLELIGNVLDFSKIEAGKLDLIQNHFSLNELLEKTHAVINQLALDKGLSFSLSINPDVPTQLYGDALRLGQVLINLCSNAVKFTDHGEVKLSIGLEAPASNKHILLRFTVSDTGIGMTPTQIQRLFQPFSQVDDSHTRRHGGTGLGLAISKQLIEKMGGQIWVESQTHHGSQFIFTVQLPLNAASNLRHEPKPASQNANLHLLIIEQRNTECDQLIQMLDTLGHTAECVPSLQAADTQLQLPNKHYDLLILDVSHLKLNTQDALKRLLRECTRSDTHLITLMSHLDQHAINPEFADAVLLKPITAHALQHAISLALGTEHSDVPTITNNKSLQEQLAGHHVLLVEDNAFNQQVARELLELVHIKVSIANNGLDAINALKNESFDLVLMDIQMPVMDGLEATRLIRSHSQYTHLPIIAMSAHNTKFVHSECQTSGMNDAVNKPVEPDVLYQTLAKWLTRTPITTHKAIEDETQTATNLTPNTLPKTLPSIDLSIGLHYSSDRVEFYLRMLGKFLDTKSGITKEAHAFIRQHDLEGLKRCAHSVKAAAGYIGAQALMQAAVTLEKTCTKNTDWNAIETANQKFVAELAIVIQGLHTHLAR